MQHLEKKDKTTEAIFTPKVQEMTQFPVGYFTGSGTLQSVPRKLNNIHHKKIIPGRISANCLPHKTCSPWQCKSCVTLEQVLGFPAASSETNPWLSLTCPCGLSLILRHIFDLKMASAARQKNPGKDLNWEKCAFKTGLKLGSPQSEQNSLIFPDFPEEIFPSFSLIFPDAGDPGKTLLFHSTHY